MPLFYATFSMISFLSITESTW